MRTRDGENNVAVEAPGCGFLRLDLLHKQRSTGLRRGEEPETHMQPQLCRCELLQVAGHVFHDLHRIGLWTRSGSIKRTISRRGSGVRPTDMVR